MNQALSFGAIAAGGVLLISSITHTSLADVLKGKVGSVSHTGQNLAGGGTAGTSPAGGEIAPSGGTVVGDVTYGQLQAIGAQHGWSGQEIQAWANVVKSESNGTITDTNPSSGAYGIAQGITGPSWYAQHGGNASTVTGQLTAMANYIAQRYKTPSAAWSFHRANNWY